MIPLAKPEWEGRARENDLGASAVERAAHYPKPGEAHTCARKEPKQQVPKTRRAFVADPVREQIPKRRISRDQPRLRFIEPRLVMRPDDGERRREDGKNDEGTSALGQQIEM